MRLRIQTDAGQIDDVSIHAPAWGATAVTQATFLPRTGFNPRTRVGCDGSLMVRLSCPLVFQSTHPRGVRLVQRAQSLFQPRFQSTHPRGVRPRWSAPSAPNTGFQSTHPRGVRRRSRGAVSITGISFNPRTRVGCDDFFDFFGSPLQSFNPRTRVGCDHGDPGFLALPESFNPRTRVGCDDGVVLRLRA